MAGATITESGTTPPGDLSEQSTVSRSLVPDDSFYEVVDGRIVELPPMGVYECGIASLLSLLLGMVVRTQRLGRIVVETMFWLDRKGNLKRRPDLAFVSAQRWPVNRSLPKTEAWDIVPDLAIEVVSETNSANDINLKLVDYFKAGVRQVWVIYPGSHQVYVYTSLTSVMILTQADELNGGDLIPGFRLSLTELFEDELTSEPSASATQ
jgi:Uma2 family endonuclease